ncbi:hypothetical protein B0T14DRAFT_189243 [Immersiella caudata]|uniref:Uncharacterized protein n=1 Tax=Immersiella caudata TaxID=314043 RepID=A0AA40C4A0_9PEZI|nr:hypothetical protein B0T14DRAFT_189243 [Immersiella caudata]
MQSQPTSANPRFIRASFDSRPFNLTMSQASQPAESDFDPGPPSNVNPAKAGEHSIHIFRPIPISSLHISLIVGLILDLTRCTITKPITTKAPSAMTQQLLSTSCSRPHGGVAIVQQFDCQLGVQFHLIGPSASRKPLEPTETRRSRLDISNALNSCQRTTPIHAPLVHPPESRGNRNTSSPGATIMTHSFYNSLGIFCGEPCRRRGPCGLAWALLAARCPAAVRTRPYRLVSAAESVVRKGKHAGCEAARAAL